MLDRLRSARIRTILVALVAAVPLLAHAPSLRAAAIGAEVFLGGLESPAAFTFAPDGTLYYGERLTGEIHIVDPVTHNDEVFAQVTNLATEGEQGLLGLALHPDYPSDPSFYAYATRVVGGVPKNQIVRFTPSGGVMTSTVIFTANAGTIHNAGRILFGPDGMLYALIGELGVPANAQNLSKNVGKVLRMTPSGGVPSDNPFPGRRIYSYGLRNSFGAAFDPVTDRLWETENGPACNDELNLIRRGGNFGWGPSQTCATPPQAPRNTNQDGPNPILPQRFYTPATAPTGAVFCSSCGLGAGTSGRFFFGEFNTHRIRKVTLSPGRTAVSSQAVVFEHDVGILSMERDAGGSLYFSDRSAIYKLVLQ